MIKKRQLLDVLDRIGLKSLALQIYHGTYLGNICAFRLNKEEKIKCPPAALMHHVAGTTEKNRFIWSGRLTMVRIVDLLNTAGVDIVGKGDLDVLDFGCGCGRLTRYLVRLNEKATVFGTDTDAVSIKWCQENLHSGNFSVNSSQPPLIFKEKTFDIVISYSVFTHIQEGDQIKWMSEIARVLKTGGVMVFSSHPYVDDLAEVGSTKEEAQRYRGGHIVSLGADMGYVQGSEWGTFHPTDSIARLANASGLQLLNTVLSQPAPPMDSAGHNLHLLRKVKVETT